MMDKTSGYQIQPVSISYSLFCVIQFCEIFVYKYLIAKVVNKHNNQYYQKY